MSWKRLALLRVLFSAGRKEITNSLIRDVGLWGIAWHLVRRHLVRRVETPQSDLQTHLASDNGGASGWGEPSGHSSSRAPGPARTSYRHRARGWHLFPWATSWPRTPRTAKDGYHRDWKEARP